jgi:hypothetical protein
MEHGDGVQREGGFWAIVETTSNQTAAAPSRTAGRPNAINDKDPRPAAFCNVEGGAEAEDARSDDHDVSLKVGHYQVLQRLRKPWWDAISSSTASSIKARLRHQVQKQFTPKLHPSKSLDLPNLLPERCQHHPATGAAWSTSSYIIIPESTMNEIPDNT